MNINEKDFTDFLEKTTRDFNNIFNGTFISKKDHIYDLKNQFQDNKETKYIIFETKDEDNFGVLVEAFGVSKENIDVYVEDNTSSLVIDIKENTPYIDKINKHFEKDEIEIEVELDSLIKRSFLYEKKETKIVVEIDKNFDIDSAKVSYRDGILIVSFDKKTVDTSYKKRLDIIEG